MSANVVDCSYLNWKAFVYVSIATEGCLYAATQWFCQTFLFESDHLLSNFPNGN